MKQGESQISLSETCATQGLEDNRKILILQTTTKYKQQHDGKSHHRAVSHSQFLFKVSPQTVKVNSEVSTKL